MIQLLDQLRLFLKLGGELSYLELPKNAHLEGLCRINPRDPLFESHSDISYPFANLTFT